MSRLPCLLVAALLTACVSSPSPASRSRDVEAVHAFVDELYAAFCFDPGSEPDWEAQRRLCVPGANFVAPIRPGRAPVAVDLETFLADFRAFATAPTYSETGLHERVVHVRADRFGGVAHAFVSFEGFHPGEGPDAPAVTRGLDSLQLVRTADGWRLASFTTQYEGDGLALPARFLRPGP